VSETALSTTATATTAPTNIPPDHYGPANGHVTKGPVKKWEALRAPAVQLEGRRLLTLPAHRGSIAPAGLIGALLGGLATGLVLRLRKRFANRTAVG
jgi:hypothetical protein